MSNKISILDWTYISIHLIRLKISNSDGNGFIKISDLENCDRNDVDFQEISNSLQSAILMDVNSARNLILLYIDPIFGMKYEKKSKYSYIAGVIINKAINEYGTLPDPLKINYKQFFS
jgi:hypothetical protein